ncbi:MAG: META domain-containing protein [Bacteroidales bacterium]|nr:META domain-containing protein [Bacteroidales bacterium]
MKIKIFNFLLYALFLFLLSSCFSFQEIGTNEYDSAQIPSGTEIKDITSVEWKLLCGKPTHNAVMIPPPQDILLTLKIMPDGRFSGYDGCNGFGGETRIKGNTIQFRYGMSTSRLCVDDRNKTKALLDGMQHVDNYAIENNKLYLKQGNQIWMIYEFFKKIDPPSQENDD